MISIKKNLERNNQNKPTLPDLMTRQKVMEYFKIGSTTLHRWTKEYQILKSIPVGGRRYYKKDDVKKLLIKNLSKS
jgi:DNA-binding transcriptional MerR regulator|tara:strand:- start:1784 stop:2011 length:228 start_codon:yes stop_codon:yes gene_type:complete